MLLSQAIDLFIDHRVAEGFSESTVLCDRKRLRRVLAIVGDMPYAQFGPTQYDTVQSTESGRGLAAGTLNNYMSTVSCFTKWGHARGYLPMNVNPIGARRRRKIAPREKVMLHMSQFAQLLDAAEKREPRDRALIALALYTMCRQSEIRTLRVKDLNLDAGTLYVRVHKTNQDDRMPVSTELDAEMRTWLKHYASEVGPLQPDWYLIPPREMVTFNTRTYAPTRQVQKPQRILQRVLEDIGFPRMKYEDGMHLLRRSAARALYTEMESKGYDGSMRQVQTWLHHSSVVMTERYLGITVDRNTRDQEVKGQSMFPSLRADNIVDMRGIRGSRDSAAL